jgi:hypothetical protein
MLAKSLFLPLPPLNASRQNAVVVGPIKIATTGWRKRIYWRGLQIPYDVDGGSRMRRRQSPSEKNLMS